MDTTILVVAMVTVLVVYEFIKEKIKIKKEKKTMEYQEKFMEKIGMQLIENSSVNKEILQYLKISTQKYSEEITESQVRIIIESMLSSSQLEIFNYISKVIKENHIKGNEKEIASKIKLYIDNRFHKDSLLLKEFKFKGTTLSSFDCTKWKSYLTENILSSVLREKGEKSLYGAIQNTYDSLKYDFLENTLS